jgi:GAF domain-containing protein
MQMIASNYKLRVGDGGIVGHVASTGEPRIAHGNGPENLAFKDSFLPNTRSEMALPLTAERSVIGVLDLQSDEPDAFREDDIAILQIMADQLATAIERTRLLQEVENSLAELKNAYGESTRENWRILSANAQSGNKGYRFDNIRIEPITELPELGKNAYETGITTSSNGHSMDHQTFVAIPVKLRGQPIGVINIKLKENYGENTISTIELASERLAAALESARLYEEARLRADREQSIAQVTSAISASTNYEEILQTTVREIGSTIRDAEISIQITGDTNDNKSNG